MDNRINLGELHRRNIPLFTREAAAIAYEVSSWLAEREEEQGQLLVPPSLDQLWVTDTGELAMEEVAPAGPGVGREQTMTALASLMEALLPSVRNEPDYAVPSSLRLLAPRARGWPPELPPIRTSGDLAAAVARYQTGDRAAVLQSLYSRAAPQFAPAEFDLPLSPLPPETWVRPVSSSPPARGQLHPWLLGAVAAMFAFAVGYEVARQAPPPAKSSTRRAHENTSATAKSGTAESRTAESASATRRDAVSADLAAPASPAAPTAPASASEIVASTPPSRHAMTTPSSRRGGTDTAPPDTSLGSAVPLELPASKPVFSPSFSATDSTLVFHAGRDPVAQLMAADLGDASAPLEVLSVAGGDARNYHPRLSPDGRYLAFDSDRDGERGVYVARRDGTEVRRVSGPGFAAVPSWSPDMRALAFVRAEADRPRVWNLWRLDRATGQQTRLTRHRFGQSWGASWFPDSRRLCYSHEDRLIVLDTETGETRTFASPRPGRLVRTPAVSPDGRTVAFQVIRDGVWLLDLNEGAMRRLIDDPSAEEFAWSPEGRRIAYHSRRSGEWRIWIAAAPAEPGTSP